MILFILVKANGQRHDLFIILSVTAVVTISAFVLTDLERAKMVSLLTAGNKYLPVVRAHHDPAV